MRRYLRSLGYAFEGVFHAFRTERNLRLFFGLYLFSFVAAAFLQVRTRDWEVLIFTGGMFLAIELVNTALERFTDAFDLHSKKLGHPNFAAIKATKDIAAGASLVCGAAWIVTVLMVCWPYAWTILRSL